VGYTQAADEDSRRGDQGARQKRQNTAEEEGEEFQEEGKEGQAMTPRNVIFKPKESFLRPLCPRGHKKWEVGVVTIGRCYGCVREDEANRSSAVFYYPKEYFRKPICPRGHKKWIVGVTRNRCHQCKVDYQREEFRRSRGITRVVPPQPIAEQCEGVRKLCGLSVNAFLRETGIARSTYQGWRSHGRPASNQNIQKVVPELKRLLDERNERIRAEQHLRGGRRAA
jgi:hypothetical protein